MRICLQALLIGLSCFTLQARAQAFEPGWVVRSNGDTLRGEVENAQWLHTPDYIRFRKANEAKVFLFRPSQLRAVHLPAAGRLFQTRYLTITHSAEADIRRIEQGAVPASHPDSLLAEVLVQGPAVLLRVVKSSNTYYYVQRPNRSVVDLTNQRRLKKSARDKGTGNWLTNDSPEYHDWLSRYFQDCPAALALLPTIAYTSEDLIKLVQAYNTSCSETRQPGGVYLPLNRRALGLNGGVLVGEQYTSISITDEARRFSTTGFLDGLCVGCKPRPVVGIYGELLFSNRRSSIYGELSGGGVGSSGRYADRAYAHEGWLVSARAAYRHYWPLTPQTQFFGAIGLEANTLAQFKNSITPPTRTANFLEDKFSPSLLPNLAIGVRWSHRLTLAVDGQLYKKQVYEDGMFSQYVVKRSRYRLTVAYALRPTGDGKLKP